MRRVLASFVMVLVLLAGCGRPEAAAADSLQVDGQRALGLAGKLAAIQPRYSGSAGAREAANFIATSILDIGLEAEIVTFSESTPHGDITFRNVLARIPGSAPGLVVVGSHYDGKYLPSIPGFQGANDSGSSTGLLLEIMRVIHEHGKWRGPELLFAFFDGEECRVRYGPNDGLHGSRRLVAGLRRDGELRHCRAMILLDMVGDRDLTVTLPADGDPALTRLVMKIAREHGHADKFGFWDRGTIIDDHVPFQQAGVPAVNIIDFRFGPNNAWWHSREDSMDKLSAESLAIVGNVTLALLQRLPEPPKD